MKNSHTEGDVLVKLVNMPFADANRPSIALTQLANQVTNQVNSSVEVIYLNQEFTVYFGKDLYQLISDQYIAGLGDWLFREIAFPDEEGNEVAYFKRHFPIQTPETQAIKKELLGKRDGLSEFLRCLISRYRLLDADILGFSSMFSQTVPSLALARLVKAMNPTVRTVIGGANCEWPMGGVLARNADMIDFVFSGPALVSFPKFVKLIYEGNDDQILEINGILNGDEEDNSLRRNFGIDLPLDAVVPLNYDSFLLDFEKNFPLEKDKVQLTFETSRGCWWGEKAHCTFCGLNSQSMAYRFMNEDKAISLLENVLSYKDRCKRFASVDNIMPKSYPEKVFSKLDLADDVEIFYEVKSDLKLDVLGKLRDANIRVVQPGIESLNTKTLKLMKKGVSAFGNVQFLINCRLADIVPEWNLLVGFPGEDPASLEKYLKDLRTLFHLPPPGGCYPVRFDRFSPYHKNSEAYGLNLQPFDFYQEVYPWDFEEIKELAYYFYDKNVQAPYFQNVIQYLPKIQALVQQWRQLWVGCTLKPALYWIGTHEILDRRSGTVSTISVSHRELELLKVCSVPKSQEQVRKALGMTEEVIRSSFDSVKSKGLLFEEGGRYLCIVMEEEGSCLSLRFSA